MVVLGSNHKGHLVFLLHWMATFLFEGPVLPCIGKVASGMFWYCRLGKHGRLARIESLVARIPDALPGNAEMQLVA